MSNYYYDRYLATTVYAGNSVPSANISGYQLGSVYLDMSFDGNTNTYLCTNGPRDAYWGFGVSLYWFDSTAQVTQATGINTGGYGWSVQIWKSSLSSVFNYKSALYQSNIVAPDGAYPDDGYSGGYWYVKKGLAFPPLKININGALKTTQDGWVNVNGVLRHIEGMWTNVNGVLKKL